MFSLTRRQPAPTTTRRTRLLAALAGLGAVLALVPSTAHADTLDLGPMTIGGSYTAESFYNPPVVLANTTCVGNTNRVFTQLVLRPDSRTAGQWFHVEFYARDITGGIGQWKLMKTDRRYVALTDAMTYQPVTATTFDFVGYEGHTYQMAVYSWVANPGGSWQAQTPRWSNHYTTFGAQSASVYGNAIQAMSGAASNYCRIL